MIPEINRREFAPETKGTWRVYTFKIWSFWCLEEDWTTGWVVESQLKNMHTLNWNIPQRLKVKDLWTHQDFLKNGVQQHLFRDFVRAVSLVEDNTPNNFTQMNSDQLTLVGSICKLFWTIVRVPINQPRFNGMSQGCWTLPNWIFPEVPRCTGAGFLTSKKHIIRLWFPPQKGGGSIPSCNWDEFDPSQPYESPQL